MPERNPYDTISGGAQLTSSDSDLPSYVRKEWVKVLPDLQLLYRLLAGTREMHRHASDYIRQWHDEAHETFKIRSKIEQVFEGLGRTLSAAVGMLFAKPPAIEWAPTKTKEREEEQKTETEAPKTVMEEHWENIDGAGTDGNVFLKQFTDTAIRDGLGLLLVDFSPPTRDPITGQVIDVRADEEKELNLRPIWASYDRERIRNWRVKRINNREEITLLVLYEPTKIDYGAFGTVTEHRWRVLRLEETLIGEGEIKKPSTEARWETWRLKHNTRGDDIMDFEKIDEGVFRNAMGETYDQLPIAIAYTGRKLETLEAVPPLMGVAWANLGLWQIASDLRFYLSLSAFPQPTVIGDLAKDPAIDADGNRISVPGRLKIGPMVAVHLSAGSEGSGPSDYKFTLPPSEGFEPNERAMVKKREDISALGMSFLQRDKRAVETAEAKKLDATAENATLATSAQAVDDAANVAWKHHQWYLGEDPEMAPTVTLNRDFESTVMSAQVMSAWISGVEKAGIPAWVLLEAWQRGGQLPEGIDVDELTMEMEMGRVAEEEQKRMEAEQRAMETAIAALGVGGESDDGGTEEDIDE